MGSIVPSWTDTGQTIISAQGLTKTNLIRGTLDLRAKPGAMLTPAIWKYGTTAFALGVQARIRRMLNNGGIINPADWWAGVCDLTAAVCPLINNAPGPYAIGTSSFAYDGTGNPATGDLVCLTEATGAPANAAALSGFELFRVSKGAATPLVVDSPSKATHADNTIISNKANVWNVWCPGGSVYEVIFDYGGETATPEAVGVACWYASYDQDTTA